MGLSGLKENVILTIDGTSLCMTRGGETLVPKGLAPLGEDHTYQHEVCVPLSYGVELRAHCGIVEVGIT